jgi:P-type E1-E2 ATPase
MNVMQQLRSRFSICKLIDPVLSKQERYVKTLWRDLRAGDLVHLSNNELIPADVLLLRSSDEHSLCYIDTCNLDGETNLKQRHVVRGFADKVIMITLCGCVFVLAFFQNN